jgi:hypothetical protein
MARQNANANKRAPRAKTGSASKASNSQGAAPAATGEQPKAKKPAHKRAKETYGIPSGVGACVAKLDEWASKDPLPPYEKGPDQVINNGLLWNDPHSKCSVGTDQAVRNKVFAVATAWQQKDSAGVKQALADLKGSVPAETPMEPKKPRRHHAAGTGKGKSANKNSGD